MIRPSKYNFVLDKLFPSQPAYTQLKPAQQQRLQIIWSGAAIFLAVLVFLGLLLLTKNETNLPLSVIPPSTPAAQNTVPGQPLELKIAAKDFKTDPNLTVIAGKVESESNFLTVRLEVGGQIVKNSTNLIVYQVAFDTDQDSSTGFQYPHAGVGAEYLADFDSKGNGLLLHWLAIEHRFETIEGGVSQKQLDAKTLIFEVSRAALGFPTELNMLWLGADNQNKIQTFLPENGYVHYKLSPQGLAAAAEVRPLWPLTLNYTQTERANSVELRQSASAALNPDYDIVYAKVVFDATTITATIQVAGKIETQPTNKAGVAYYQLLLDTNSSSKGNFSVSRLGLDAKYLADYDSNGFNSILHWLPKSTSFEGVNGLLTNVSTNTLTFTLPLANIGNPNSISFGFVAQDNRLAQQNYLPDLSSALLNSPLNTANATISNTTTTADKSLQISTVNLEAKDGFLNLTLKTAAPIDFSSQSQASYQLLLGSPLTQTTALTATVIISNNVIAPQLQVYYKVVYTPGRSATEAQLWGWSEQNQAFEKLQSLAVTVQGDTLGLKVPQAVIGSGPIGYYLLTYDPQNGFSTLSPQSAPGYLLLPGSSHFTLTPALAQGSSAISPTLISQVDLQNNNSALAFTLKATQPIPSTASSVDYTSFQFWIDQDSNPQTGLVGLHPTLGIDYLLKFDSRLSTEQVQVYNYDQTTKGLVLVQIVPAQVGADRKQLSFELPSGLLNSSSFRLVVYANMPAANLTQLLPAGDQDFAQLNFQIPTNAQTLTSTSSSSDGPAWLDLKTFGLKYDNFFVKGDFGLAALPQAGAKANYIINLTAFAPDPKASVVTSKFSPTYYVISYDTELDRAVLKRWSDSSQTYKLVSQVDRVLDGSQNTIELSLPYTLLGQPTYVTYIAGLNSQTSTKTLPGSSTAAGAVPTLNQSVATFYFKSPTTNSFSQLTSMKQITSPQR